jgi:hypothetical protein
MAGNEVDVHVVDALTDPVVDGNKRSMRITPDRTV